MNLSYGRSKESINDHDQNWFSFLNAFRQARKCNMLNSDEVQVCDANESQIVLLKSAQ
mgnify:CR=1 FL=1